MPLPSELSPEFVPRDMMPDDLREDVDLQEGRTEKRKLEEEVYYALEKPEEEIIEKIDSQENEAIRAMAEQFVDFFEELPDKVKSQILQELEHFSEGDPQKRLEFAQNLATQILEEFDQVKLEREAKMKGVKEILSPDVTSNRQVSSRIGKLQFHGKPNTYFESETSAGIRDRNVSRAKSSKRNYGRKPPFKHKKGQATIRGAGPETIN